ncbi:MAG: HDIG domain-containing metalloprotein [Spirochaetales bacterium]
MSNHTPDRNEALNLVQEHIKNENLRKHCLAVEAVMRHFAREYGEDEEKWGVIGLVHDLDWEEHPDEHCTHTRRILEERDWPEDYIHAVMSHAWGMFTEEKPEHTMEKVLYTIDELTGLVTATALVRPSKSLLDMKPKSVKKKWKESGFAAGANRQLIESGAAMLGMELSDVIAHTIEGMKVVAGDLGLDGQA